MAFRPFRFDLSTKSLPPWQCIFLQGRRVEEQLTSYCSGLWCMGGVTTSAAHKPRRNTHAPHQALAPHIRLIHTSTLTTTEAVQGTTRGGGQA